MIRLTFKPLATINTVTCLQSISLHRADALKAFVVFDWHANSRRFATSILAGIDIFRVVLTDIGAKSVDAVRLATPIGGLTLVDIVAAFSFYLRTRTPKSILTNTAVTKRIVVGYTGGQGVTVVGAVIASLSNRSSLSFEVHQRHFLVVYACKTAIRVYARLVRLAVIMPELTLIYIDTTYTITFVAEITNTFVIVCSITEWNTCCSLVTGMVFTGSISE